MASIQTSDISTGQTAGVQVVKQCEICKASDNQLLRCARCKKVYYCNVDCQKKHWSSHKIICSKPKENETSQTEKKSSQTALAAKPQPQQEFHGLNEFGQMTHLGSGNFSQIFKATSKKDGKTYAIKQVQKAKVQRVRKQADLYMEKHCLSKLKECNYVINLYRTFQDQLNLFIQMECPENGQLWEKCKTFGLFSQSLFKYYAIHLVKAIHIIHDQFDIVHRDLKPENILLDQNNHIKLIDFGTARDLSRPDIQGAGNGLKGKKVFEHYVGTPNYMAPQCIHNKSSQKKCDIYSLSGVFYFMKIGSPPFTGGSEFIIFKKTLQTEMDLCPQLFSLQLKDLMLKMNKKQIEQRYDINQVMAHDYFKDVDWNNLPTYGETVFKITELEKFLESTGKALYKKFNKVALDGTLQERKATYDKEILSAIQTLKDKLPTIMKSSKQEQNWLEKRLNIMKIQAKVMLNYHDDYSTGFVEVYNNDFNSAQRVINQVKNSKNYQKQENQQNQQDQRDEKKQQEKDERKQQEKDERKQHEKYERKQHEKYERKQQNQKDEGKQYQEEELTQSEKTDIEKKQQAKQSQN